MRRLTGTLVKLPNGNFVNMANITCVELTSSQRGTWTYLRTGGGRIAFKGDVRDELAATLNGEGEAS